MTKSNSETMKAKAKLKDLGVLIPQYVKQFNKSGVAHSAMRLQEGIVLGRLCIEAKILAKMCGIKWANWRDEHIAHYSVRSVEDYMRLAAISKVDKYILLGKARLMLILEAIDEKGDDPIGHFLNTNDIQFDPEDPKPVDDVRKMVDYSLAIREFSLEGYDEVDHNLVKYMVERGTPIGTPLFKKLEIAKLVGGDINKFLQAYCQNGGDDSGSKFLAEVSNKIRYQHFNELAKRITETLKELKGSGALQEIDRSILKNLHKQLEELDEKLPSEQSETISV